jgi:hypothetical protein
LAALLGAPRSAVRGRLYHGRRQLRRALRPLADSVLTADRSRREGQAMDPDALIDAEVAFVGRMMFSSDRMVMLQERDGPRRLPLDGVDATTGEAVERLIGQEQPLAPATHDLLPRRRSTPRSGARVEHRLERLRSDLDGSVALLTHDSGTLVAWVGPGDPDVIARYCQARADRDADLTQLLLREVFPPAEVEAVMFRTVGRLSRVEVGIAGEHTDELGKQFAERTDQAVRELEALLPPGSA